LKSSFFYQAFQSSVRKSEAEINALNENTLEASQAANLIVSENTQAGNQKIFRPPWKNVLDIV